MQASICSSTTSIRPKYSPPEGRVFQVAVLCFSNEQDIESKEGVDVVYSGRGESSAVLSSEGCVRLSLSD